LVGFGFCTPAGVAVVGILHIDRSLPFSPPVKVKLGKEFIGEGFFLDKFVFFGPGDRAIIAVDRL
jgi:hypothetical protein